MKATAYCLSIMTGLLLGTLARQWQAPQARAAEVAPAPVVRLAQTDKPVQPVKPRADVPFVELPAALRVDVGDVELVPVKTNGKAIQWSIANKSGIQVLPQYPPGGFVPSGLLLIKTKVPGTYDLVVYTALADVPSKPTVCTITVGQGPEPVPPPVPPVPPVPPPEPTDPFTKELQALYVADASPDKARHKASLAALYRQAVPVANDVTIASTGALLTTLRAAAASLLPADALPAVRRRIAGELNIVLADDVPLTPELRDKAGKLFARVAVALEQVR